MNIPGSKSHAGTMSKSSAGRELTLRVASSDLGLNFMAGPSDTRIMKIKLNREMRKTASEPADPFLGVKAFLAASRAAAGEPLGQSAIRARIQQDPLGALRERLAAG
jgi:hypothetical protein